MNQTNNPLGTEKVSSLLIKFSIPAIIGMMVNALYNIVDRIFIGNAPDLGKAGLAGITIAFPIMIILIGVGILFGVGGATLFSIKLGEKKKKEAEVVLGNSFALLIISGLFFMVLGQIFLTPLLELFGASEAVLPYATSYMRVIFFGAIFQVLSLGMNNFLRADGNPRMAMITMFAGAGVNILLDPLFIFGFNMGMEGAALATILSQFISMMWVLYYFFGKRGNHSIYIKNMKLNLAIVLNIIALGIPGFLLQISASILNAVLNKTLLEYGGDVAVSGMGIINSVQTLLLMPIIGLNQGVQPIVSYNFGAKQYDRIKETQKLAITAATAIVLVGFILTRLFPEQIVMFFNKDEELVNVASRGVVAWFWLLPVVGFQIIASNFFQAIGRPKSAMVLTLSRQLLILLPAILVLSRQYGSEGILYAAPIADFISVLVTGTWFYFGITSLGKNQVQSKSYNSILEE
ncbi:MAG: MATE family efflux transporter [Acholeplasma sp.]|nr:MATE family efflux transporter [Acholeplasma sp.]